MLCTYLENHVKKHKVHMNRVFKLIFTKKKNSAAMKGVAKKR